jgi:hypothetical protein
MMVTVKYVLVILHADNDGEGMFLQSVCRCCPEVVSVWITTGPPKAQDLPTEQRHMSCVERSNLATTDQRNHGYVDTC